MVGFIYRLKFPGGKVYIGITRETVDRRVRRHIAYARGGRAYAISAAIRKYGETSFTVEVIGRGSWPELKAMEVDAILLHGSLCPGGYNMTAGGDGSLGVPVSDEKRAKISASLKGRRLSEEHRRRVSEAQIGKVIPLATREKMRQAALGKVISEEQRRKVSAALNGRKRIIRSG